MLMIQVTHIVNPHLMWWKFKDDFLGAKLIERIEGKLNIYMSQLPHDQEKKEPFEIGDNVAVFYQAWQKYVRGIVHEVYNHDASATAYIVWLVDHGFPIKTSHSLVRRLPEGELQKQIVYIYRGGIANLQLKKLPADTKAKATESSETWQYCCEVCKVTRCVLTNNMHSVYIEDLYVEPVIKHHWCQMEVKILEDTFNIIDVFKTLDLGARVPLAEFRRLSGKLQTSNAIPWLKCDGTDNFHNNIAIIEKTSERTLSDCTMSTRLKVNNWLNQSAQQTEVAGCTFEESVKVDNCIRTQCKTESPTADCNANATHQPQLQTDEGNKLDLANAHSDRKSKIEKDLQEDKVPVNNVGVTQMNLHMSKTIKESSRSVVNTEIKAEEDHTSALPVRNVEACKLNIPLENPEVSLQQTVNPRWVELKCDVLTEVLLGDGTDWANIYLQLIGKDYASKLNALDSYIQDEMFNLMPAQESTLVLGANYVVRYEESYHRAQLYRICNTAEFCYYQFFLVDLAKIVDVIDEDIGRGEVFESTPEIVNFTDFQAVHCTLMGVQLNPLTQVDCVLSTNAHLYAFASFDDKKVANFFNIHSYKVALFVCDDGKDFDMDKATPIQGIMLNKVLIDYKYAEPDTEMKLLSNKNFGLKENPVLPQENTSLYNFQVIAKEAENFLT